MPCWLLAILLLRLTSCPAFPDEANESNGTFGASRPEFTLSFPAEEQSRRTLPNGTEIFLAHGTVTNVAKDAQKLPQLLIVLRDAEERQVLSWVATLPKAQLAPGESIKINEAVTDVPKSAKIAEIGWKPD